ERWDWPAHGRLGAGSDPVPGADWATAVRGPFIAGRSGGGDAGRAAAAIALCQRRADGAGSHRVALPAQGLGGPLRGRLRRGGRVTAVPGLARGRPSAANRLVVVALWLEGDKMTRWRFVVPPLGGRGAEDRLKAGLRTRPWLVVPHFRGKRDR